MIELEEARRRIGRVVVYITRPELPIEQGVVTGANEKFVFVRYGGDLTSKATRPEDLEWIAP